MARTIELTHEDSQWFRLRIMTTISIAVVGMFIAGITLRFLLPIRDLVLVVELIAFGVVAVAAGAAIWTHYRERYQNPEVVRCKVAIRAVRRTVSHSTLGVACVSIFAKSAALAVSVDSFSGVLIGLAAKTTIGNVFAGMVVAISRPLQIGGEVTGMGSQGKITEIGAMFARLDAGEESVLIPNNVLLSQAIQTKKRGQNTDVG